MNGLMTVNLFTDATLHSKATIIPTTRLYMAFNNSGEIDRAKALCALWGLSWAPGKPIAHVSNAY